MTPRYDQLETVACNLLENAGALSRGPASDHQINAAVFEHCHGAILQSITHSDFNAWIAFSEGSQSRR